MPPSVLPPVIQIENLPLLLMPFSPQGDPIRDVIEIAPLVQCRNHIQTRDPDPATLSHHQTSICQLLKRTSNRAPVKPRVESTGVVYEVIGFGVVPLTGAVTA